MPFDILISGGGIAGPSLAYWLTRQGHVVTIVEQAQQLRTGGQAVDYRDTEGNKKLFAQRYAGMGWEVPHILEDLAEAPVVYFDSIAQVHLDSYARGRVCLTGDAAWCASPRSGMGTTLAMVGSYVLAHELHSAEGDFAEAFDRYQRLMEPHAARCQSLAVQALKTDRYSSGWRATLRNLVLRMLRIPAVSNLVARQSPAPARSFTLPDY